MKLKHSQLFLASLYEPKKLAAYRIMPIGKVIQYAFLLITAMTVFSLGKFFNNEASQIFAYKEIEEFASDLKWLVYAISIVFLFVMNTLILFAKISVYAYVGQLFLKPMKRRGEYRQVWRTATFAITWEVILSIILSLFAISSTISILLFIIVTMSILFMALKNYPKMPQA
ncbi:DUF1189 family protein [Metasolibacillus sp.]|uniref:DUF1189 family protein n=1 Tax=Metasolibacillus sp. TaxID=2703680 RepID=UPI0025DE2590|nr:DUF1189 family protein [Metasolibacillus sp.]MCT6922610.1 DUF1189 domain-containing protein [Metasolibacillus sp.]MCT6939051.1 DUF1189 domain-containing protein [Metasolibacillus sp.]